MCEGKLSVCRCAEPEGAGLATPLDLKAEADVHVLQGINQLIGHGWAYTPPQVEYPGWRFYAAGEYSDRNPWWIVMPDLAKYLQRVSWLMRQGEPSNDVALYLPNADAYAQFTPAKVHLIEVQRELVGEKLMPALFESGYNLDFFDDQILQKFGRVKKDGITLGSSNHRVIVLPGITRMPLASLRKLDEFVKNGGILLATRKTPSIVPGYSASVAEQNELKALTAALFSGNNPRVKFVERDEDAGEVLKSMLAPDAAISPNGKDFGFVHRKTADADIYFIANTSNLKKNVEVTFRAAAPSVSVWNAMNGTSTPAEVKRQTTDSTSVILNFEPYQSHIVVFSKSKAPEAFNKPKISNLATVDLSTGWNVTFGKDATVSMNKLTDWISSEQTRYFSGTAVYEKTFDSTAELLNGEATLDFGPSVSLEAVQQKNGMATYLNPPVKEAAVVYLNDQRVGSLWSPPYNLDIKRFLRPGQNRLKVVVANTAINYMAGRRLPDYKLLILRYGDRFQPQEMEKVVPYPSGLTGPIRIVTFNK